MAIYEFECLNCGKTVGLLRNVGDFEAVCPECGIIMQHNPVVLYARTNWLVGA